MTCLIEGVHIGENSLIGAGSIVTKDVYSNSTVVGNPGRVIGENKHPEYIQNRWLIKR
jgi:acetyltransferase-like isoleucine patch superfamily enzyme